MLQMVRVVGSSPTQGATKKTDFIENLSFSVIFACSELYVTSLRDIAFGSDMPYEREKANIYRCDMSQYNYEQSE